MIEKCKPKHLENLKVHIIRFQQILRDDFNSVGGILQNAERWVQNAAWKVPNDSEFSGCGSQTEWIRFHLGSFNLENGPKTSLTEFPNPNHTKFQSHLVFCSLLNTKCRMPNDLKFSDWVRKLSESGFMKGLYTWKTDLKVDSLSFLTLNTKLQSH